MKQGRLETKEQNGQQSRLTEDSGIVLMATGPGMQLVGQTEVAHARYTAAKLHPQGHHPLATGLPPPPSRGADTTPHSPSTTAHVTPLSNKTRNHIPSHAPANVHASQPGSEVAAHQSQLSHHSRDRPFTPPSNRPFSRQALMPSRLGSPMPRVPRTPLHHPQQQPRQHHHTLPRGAAAQYTADGLFGSPAGMQAPPKPPNLYLARPGSKSGRATPPPSLSSTLSNPLLSPRGSINQINQMEVGFHHAGMHHAAAQPRPSQPLSARRPRQALGGTPAVAHLGGQQEQQQLQQWPSRTPLAQRQQPSSSSSSSTAGHLQQQQQRQHLPSRMGRTRQPPPRTPQLRQPPPPPPLMRTLSVSVQPPPPPPPPRTPQVAVPPQQQQQQQATLSSMPHPPFNPWRQHGTGLHPPDVSTQASSIPSFGGSLATSEWATNRGSSAMGGPRPGHAGVRGPMGTEVPIDNGPNAFENDGRPGTRGGGTMYDLEGRPLTRGGGRPPSRMQMSAAAAAAAAATTAITSTAIRSPTVTGLDGPSPACTSTAATSHETFGGSSTGPLTLPPRTYASVASLQHHQHQLSQSLGHPGQARAQQHHRSSIPAPPSPSSPSRSHQAAMAWQPDQQRMAHSNAHISSTQTLQQPSRLPQAKTHPTGQSQHRQQEGPDILSVEDFVDRLPSDDDEGLDAEAGALPCDLQHWMDTSNPSTATGLCTLKAGAT